MAALFNALKITGKRLEDLQVAMVGLGAAGIAVTRMLLQVGRRRDHRLRHARRDLRRARRLGRDAPAEALVRREHELRAAPRRSRPTSLDGADLFIGLSGPGVIEAHDLERMNDDAMVFAMANPEPEVMPEEAAQYARIVATGRSDYPNQINNVLCFPGLFRGALDARAAAITEEMKLAAAHGDRRRDLPTRSCPRTTSSRASSTAAWRRRSPRRSPTRPAAPASHARARCSRRPPPRACAPRPARRLQAAAHRRHFSSPCR